MHGCNTKVTLWHRNKVAYGEFGNHNQDIKSEEFTRFVLPALCKWDDTLIRTATDKGAVISQVISIIIPYAPDFDLNCRAGDIKVAIGDFMALGEHDIDITNIEPYRIDDVKKMLGNKFMQVKSVADNTRQARGKHYEVIGV